MSLFQSQFLGKQRGDEFQALDFVTDIGHVRFLLLQNLINVIHRYSLGGWIHHSVPVREGYEKNMSYASETQQAGSAESTRSRYRLSTVSQNSFPYAHL